MEYRSVVHVCVVLCAYRGDVQGVWLRPHSGFPYHRSYLLLLLMSGKETGRAR